jgi:hypothetical protein
VCDIGILAHDVQMKTPLWTKPMSPNFEIHRHRPRNRGENLVPECWYRNPVGRCLVPEYTQSHHEYRISTELGMLVPD